MRFNTILLLCSLLFCFACGKEDPTPPVKTGGPVTSTVTELIQDEFEGVPVVVIGGVGDGYMQAYERRLPDGTLLDFEVVRQDFPVVMKDNEGTEWDFFGRGIEGPRKGAQLQAPHSYMGFWFAWGTMYPGVELYDGPAYTGNFQQAEPADEWAIPTLNLIAVVGLDGIPAVDQPVFEAYNEKEAIENGYFVADEELVVGIEINDVVHLYPHSILNWHEVVNDQIGDRYFSLSFCPLTGTAIAWDREIDGEVTTFGVSGLLYNSNVIPYDRKTSSNWSQMRQDCINGELIGRKMTTYPLVEAKWSTWKNMLEAPLMLTRNTGFGKNYDTNPYGSYIQDHSSLSFPIEYDDDRVPRKERVLGLIVNGKAKVYRFNDLYTN